jgi:Protein of unknown function (DUF1350)
MMLLPRPRTIFLLLRIIQLIAAFAPAHNLHRPVSLGPGTAKRNRQPLHLLFSRRPTSPSTTRRGADSDDDDYRTDRVADDERPSSPAYQGREYWDRSEDDPASWESASDYRTRLERDVPEWEPCKTDSDGTAWVLLPPPSVVQPTAVIHFVGGTLLGSSPQVWYRQLLEGIVKNTSAAVVASTIPLTLTKSPLNHVRLARSLQRQFEIAYNEVLIDEYGPLPTVPVCGMGHSLGARLLVVRATLGERPRRTPPPYKSFILMSFTNHRAASGIPGLAELSRRSRDLEQRPTARQRRTSAKVDSESDDILQSMTEYVKSGTNYVQALLTPAPSSLEFYPSPGELWKAISEGQRYLIPQTLVVQFDDDPIDQSSQLATSIGGNVKFCRLRGTHLLPASSGGSEDDSHAKGNRANPLERLLARATTSRENINALRELRQSIARYITEVVTKT